MTSCSNCGVRVPQPTERGRGGRVPPLPHEFRTHLAAPLLDATPMQCRSFLLVNAERWSPGTLSATRRALRSFYRWAHEQALVEVNPALSIPAVRTPETLVWAAGQDVRGQLVEACRSVRDRAMVSVLFGTGCRRGEMLRLTVDAVDIEARTILIEQTITSDAINNKVNDLFAIASVIEAVAEAQPN